MILENQSNVSVVKSTGDSSAVSFAAALLATALLWIARILNSASNPAIHFASKLLTMSSEERPVQCKEN